MTQALVDLTAADAAEQASADALAAGVQSMAAQQSVLLQDVINDLAGLGNNDQVTAIAQKIAARKAQLDVIANQVAQLTSDQAAEDAEINPPVATPPVDETPAPDGSADAGEPATAPAATA